MCNNCCSTTIEEEPDVETDEELDVEEEPDAVEA